MQFSPQTQLGPFSQNCIFALIGAMHGNAAWNGTRNQYVSSRSTHCGGGAALRGASLTPGARLPPASPRPPAFPGPPPSLPPGLALCLLSSSICNQLLHSALLWFPLWVRGRTAARKKQKPSNLLIVVVTEHTSAFVLWPFALWLM